ncbi:MAG TPA: Asp-tRNA(Asn)/Glu-tRNA(Gln) amidotransferase subunit GatB [Candidatus Eisenbacteria bacterium]|nr:Asp-tRNA(Asn)/Glu-tRNA(Gln) amidotransferase subunit GatB [Candidatus Eisenbacteria bacterium]
MKYQAVIGLEVHAQLLTQSKIFCGCSTRFGAAPNQNTCPVCAGFPGVLPVLNRQVVEFALKAGLATHCRIAESSRFARKNYFYPDLPKGYQISQYDAPICSNGYVEIETREGGVKRVRLTRIHMEEDAGKSIHEARGDASLVDLNRAGVPLLEIVSEPDLHSAAEATAYLKTLRAILQYLEICDGNMEEGSFRCDANVSVRPEGTSSLGTKTELKNLNSFKAVEKALEYEIRRHTEALAAGRSLVQETRLWDAEREATRSMREKELAHDYRYFPDPDLLPVQVDTAWIEKVRSTLPELPGARKQRFIAQYRLPAYDAELLTQRKDVADYFEAASKLGVDPKSISNWIVGDLFRVIKERRLDDRLYITDWPLAPERLAELVQLIGEGKISGKIAKTIFEEMLVSGRPARVIVAQRGLEQISDPASIEKAIDEVLAAHPEQIAQYRAGNEKIIAFLVGRIMKAARGKLHPQKTNELLRQKLDERKR